MIRCIKRRYSACNILVKNKFLCVLLIMFYEYKKYDIYIMYDKVKKVFYKTPRLTSYNNTVRV